MKKNAHISPVLYITKLPIRLRLKLHGAGWSSFELHVAPNYFKSGSIILAFLTQTIISILPQRLTKEIHTKKDEEQILERLCSGKRMAVIGL